MTEFKEENGQWVDKPWYGHSVMFDREGRVIEIINRNTDGTTWRTVNHYTDDDRLFSTQYFDPQGDPSGGATYLYDERGNLREEKSIGGGSHITQTNHYRYDERGRKTKEQILKSASAEAETTTTTAVGIEGTDFSLLMKDAYRIETRYDEHDRPLDVHIYNREGLLASRIEIRRDEEGKVLEEVQYLGEVPPFSNACNVALIEEKKEDEAPSAEQVAEAAAEMERMFAPGTEFTKQTHIYDTEGQQIERRMTMLGMTAFHQQFHYNEHGDQAEVISFEQDGGIQSRAIFEREYDERGNWTVEKVLSQDDETGMLRPFNIQRRAITYF